MKKCLIKLSLVAMAILLLPFQAVEACCGFIIGRQLTKDGTTLFGRTEDCLLYTSYNPSFDARLGLIRKVFNYPIRMRREKRIYWSWNR